MNFIEHVNNSLVGKEISGMPFGSKVEFKGIVSSVDGFSVDDDTTFLDVSFDCGSTCSLSLKSIKIMDSPNQTN